MRAINIVDNGNGISTSKQMITTIPYYAWAHRGKGEMTVWFPTRIKEVGVFAVKVKLLI